MTINQILESIDESVSLKLIAQAYTEIASGRLKKIRQEVERNRYFFDDLSQVYKVVKHLAFRHKVNPAQKNNRTASILITSNYRFYGNINDDLIRFFVVSTTKNPSDRFVIGKTGKTFLQAINYTHQYTPITLAKDLPTTAELNNLSLLIKNYSRVLVYFSKMESVLIQKPIANDITQSAILTPEEIAASKSFNIIDLMIHPQIVNQKAREEDFLFEPNIIKMLEFFESQVSTLLLEQAFLESELSRTASRLISMDQAQSNADELIGEQNHLLNLANESLDNEKVLEIAVAIERLRHLNTT